MDTGRMAFDAGFVLGEALWRLRAQRGARAMVEREKEQAQGFQFVHLIAAFSMGAIAGVAVAWLTAPRSGADTRAWLRAFSKDTVGRLPTAIREARTAAQEAFLHALREDHHDAPIVAASQPH